MTDTAIVSVRGQITLPSRMRNKYGLVKDTPILIEETDEGLLLKKMNYSPVKIYSEKEIKDYVDRDKILPRDKKWMK